jgi:hypothetical protein
MVKSCPQIPPFLRYMQTVANIIYEVNNGYKNITGKIRGI